MDHIDLPAELANLLFETLRDAAHALAPDRRPAFGQEIDLPPVTLPADFGARLAAVEAALERGDYLRVMSDGRALIAQLRSSFSADLRGVSARDFTAAASDGTNAGTNAIMDDLDIELQKLLLPRVLGWLQRKHPWLHVTATLLVMADDRVQEWYPQGLVERWWDQLIVRAFKTWKQQGDSDPEHAGDYGINAAIDALVPIMMFTRLGRVGAAPGGHEGLHLREKSMDWWLGYGHEPADPDDPSTAEEVAERSATLWWEHQPEAEYDVNASEAERNRHYALTPPPVQPARRMALSLMPMRRELGGPFLVPLPHSEFGGSVDISEDWKLEMEASQQSGFATGQASAKLSYQRDEPLFTFGKGKTAKDGLSLSFARAELAAKAGWEFGAFKDESHADVVLRFKGAKLGLGSTGGSTGGIDTNDILSRLLPKKLTNSFDFGLGINSETGFYWEGGTGAETFVPVQSKDEKDAPAGAASLAGIAGPRVEMSAIATSAVATSAVTASGGAGISFKVPHLRLAMNAAKGPEGFALTLDAGLALRLALGPVTLTAEGLGACIDVAWREKSDGNLGPLHVDLRATAPDRFGLVIDADRITGGGFVAHDEGADRWIGALSLQFSGRALDGVVLSEAGSFLGIVWARGLNIPLLGGQLDGLGALLGSDRRVDRDAFVLGLRDGVLDTVLFPADPVGQAPQLLGTLARLFPRADGRTVLGLMARWVFGGQARLVVAELGLLVEFQGSRLNNLTLLGQAQVRIRRLPANLFSINVEIFGQLDFDAGEYFLKATLRDSRLVGGELTGGGLLFYSPAQGFIASLGGFNPRYPAPPRLGTIERLSVKIADSERLKIAFEAYQALTSTSFQMGGKLSLWAGAHGFAIEGMLSLDVLARFNMEFFVDVAAVVAIKRGSRALASIDLTGTLSGVSPWRLNGRAKFKLLFLKVTIPVDFTFGGDERAEFEPADARAPLLSALADPENWTAEGTPRGLKLLDRRREGVWLDARQAIRVSQAVVPLEQTITRLGASPLRAPKRFAIDSVRLGGTLQAAADIAPVHENFAGGLFQDLDLNEAVRAPQFEAMRAGMQLGSGQATAGTGVDDGGRFDRIVIDDRFVAGTAASGSAATAVAAAEPLPSVDDFYAVDSKAVRLQPARYLVTDSTGSAALMGALVGDRRAAAADGLTYAEARLVRRKAWQQGVRCQVVRRHEARL